MSFKYETHMHTSEGSGCGGSTGAEQARAYKKRGYQGIIITDHFINGYSSCPINAYFSSIKDRRMIWEKKMEYVVAGYKAAKAEGDRIGLDVFLGWEFTVRGSDFLTYGLDWDFLIKHPDVDKLDVPEYSALVRACGGFIAQAHPYRKAAYIEYQFPVAPELLDAVEVYNASDTSESNNQALKFAIDNNLPFQAGSDSHRAKLRFSSGIELKTRAESIFDIINAIKAREVELIVP